MNLEMRLGNVEFLGKLDFLELVKVVARAKFCVLPSEVYENCPMAVLEAMALGKPVIGSNIGGIPELINDGDDGLLFDTGNADDLAEKINWMLKNSRKTSEMGLEARKKIERKYNPDIHYQKVMEQYERLLN
jgi:glycosyltransferase involved in cell wall biosynthesis